MPINKLSSGEIQYLNCKGYLHRTDGPAVIIPAGMKRWYLNGKLHRIDGPAITTDFEEWWYIKGKRVYEFEHPFNIFRRKYNLSNDITQWPCWLRSLFYITYT